MREGDPSADPTTPQSQRQVFLRHGTSTLSLSQTRINASIESIRLLRSPNHTIEENHTEERTEAEESSSS